MTSYEVFAPFYDAVQGDRAQDAAYLRELIEKRRPAARTVLELACGTGSILEQLQSHYEVTGLDLSEPMLAVAADKVPGVRLLRGDTTQFELPECFDVVLCVYDSINHLLDFAQWEQVFDRAHECLNEGGIFVFDINTDRQLASLAAQPPFTHWFGKGHLLVMNVRSTGGNEVVWDIRVFEHEGDSRYRLHVEEIREVSFPRDRIEASLRRRFTRVSTHDRRRSRPTVRSERLHFVCEK